MQNVKIWFIVGLVSAASVIMLKASDDIPSGFAAMGKTLPDDTPYLTDIKQKIADEKWKEIPHEETQKLPSLSEEEKNRGYVIFSRHYLDPVYSSSLPASYEITKELRIFAAPGEYEPCSFSIHALRDIKNLKITVTDFLDESGNLINKNNIDIRAVRILPYRIGKENEYEMKPAVLEKRDKVNIAQETTRQFWITVKIPENAVPGFYKASLQIEAPEQQPAFLTFRVRVLPVKLSEPDVAYGMCYHISAERGMHPENTEKHFWDMAAHGMNSMWVWPRPAIIRKEGKIEFDFSKTCPAPQYPKYFSSQTLEELVCNYRKVGFNQPWLCGSLSSIYFENLGYKSFSKEYDEVFIDCIKQLLQTAKDKNWPPFYLHYIDEPGNNEGATKRAKYYWAMIKGNFPQLKIYSDAVPHVFDTLDPWVDVRAYNGGYVTEAEILKTKKSGDIFGIYNLVSGRIKDPKRDRLCWGLYTYRINAKLNYQWVYAWPVEQTATEGYVFCSPEGPIPTLSWEGVREGIDDLKYMKTLENLIAKAKQSQRPDWIAEAKKAEDELNGILLGIPFEGVRVRGETVEALNSRTFDVYRWKIAEHIMKLQNLGVSQ